MLVITKSDLYKVSIGGIRAMLNNDKERAEAFERGESIEVTEEEFGKIYKLKWCLEVPEVQDGN